MRYTFEKMRGKSSYQVRLKGEFITYSPTKDPEYVDAILKENGWNSREQYYEYIVSERIESIKDGE